MRPGEEVYEKNSMPIAKLQVREDQGRINVGVFACIARGSHTNYCDRLGLYASQSVQEIQEFHITPFVWSLCDNPNHLYFAANRATWHQGHENNKLCEMQYSLGPPNSPEFNSIENLWLHLERRLKKCLSEEERRPQIVGELFVTTKEALQHIDQDTIDDLIDSMLYKMQVVIEAHGGHTKWLYTSGFPLYFV